MQGPNGSTDLAGIRVCQTGAHSDRSSGGAQSGGELQVGELDVWAYTKGFPGEFRETDPRAREFPGGATFAPNMADGGRCARPLGELKVAVGKPLPRGTPKGVFERGGKYFAHAQDSGRPFFRSEFRNRGGCQTRERVPRLALWSCDKSLGTKTCVS